MEPIEFQKEEMTMNKMKKYIRKTYRYFEKTYKNKLVALALTALGVISGMVANDFTFLVWLLIFIIPLTFAKENQIR